MNNVLAGSMKKQWKKIYTQEKRIKKTKSHHTLLFSLDGQFDLHSLILVYFIKQIGVKH